ncbi:MAG: hypothetical protein QGG72_03995 [Verrucomicrobiota bacterium]|nr:hypothetical protein [Verrucomicrobiota bacterium]
MTDERPTPNPPLWLVMLAAAMAGGMGWGIRGQYGHETGAMIAGVLVSLVLVFLFCPGNRSIHVIRAAALGTIAMGFGGSMTYGQTVGLTHDTALIGDWAALRWGMLGLAIKGGVWIGFAGFFLGLGLGGKRYRPFEMFLLVLGMLTAVVVGWWLFNSPHDPEHKRLPFLYFSDHWKWEPGVEFKSRPEIWGGLLCALLTGILYATLAKVDRLARNLALWGMLGGALGFPLGQSLQANHGWNRTQQGKVTVSYDGREPVSLLELNAKAPTRYDETMSMHIYNPSVLENWLGFRHTTFNPGEEHGWPTGAKSMIITWDHQGHNSWWWSIDNIEIVSEQQPLFAENFDSLDLGPFVSESESGGDGTDWTASLPSGWTMTRGNGHGPKIDHKVIDELQTNIETIAEFDGWTFVDPASWNATAGQGRDRFAKGTGIIAVADSDKFNDKSGAKFNASLSTPPIDLTGIQPETLVLRFDSSWRQKKHFMESITQYFNWWNIMETTFGTVMGAVLGLGLWLNRRRIAVSSEPDVSPLPAWLVGLLLSVHVMLIGLVEFSKFHWIDGVYDLGVMMGLIPLVLCVQGRWGPYLMLLPITLLPIAGKTLRALVDPAAFSVTWLAYLILPMLLATTIAVWFARQAKPGGEHPYFIRCALLFCVWFYHDLNFAFFGFPWPWEDWGGRHPNASIFFICMLGLSAVALFYNPTDRRWQCKAWQCDGD